MGFFFVCVCVFLPGRFVKHKQEKEQLGIQKTVHMLPSMAPLVPRATFSSSVFKFKSFFSPMPSTLLILMDYFTTS